MGTVTAGGFDAGLGSLTRLWRDSRRTGSMPSDAALDRAVSCAGRQAWTWDAGASTFTARRDGVRMDFGAIGQGLAADDALSALRDAGCARALVDVSGDIAVGDAPPGEPGWRIEIEPGVDGQPRETLLLQRIAVSTSGDAAQMTRVAGRMIGHILDPSTGRPLAISRQATVIAPDAATADAVATALCTLPLDQAIAVARSATIAARIDRHLDDGGVHVVGRWNDLRRASSGPAVAPAAPEAPRPSSASPAADPPGSPARPSM
jgi:thiamine biosynthesis lipoprotein